VTTPAARTGFRSSGHLAQTVWLEHRLPVLLTAAHLGLYQLFFTIGVFPAPPWSFLTTGYAIRLLTFAACWLPLLVALSIWRRDRSVPIWQTIRSRYLNAATLIGVPIAVVFFAQAAVAHDAWKNLLGRVTPWTWDARLADADRILHFGTDPWRLLEPVFRFPALVIALDTLYWMWFLLIAVVAGWIFWTPRRALRTRFLIVWSLMWILLGTFLAHLMPSGGPVFYGRLVGGIDPFSELLAHLARVNAAQPLMAAEMQELVWRNAQAGGGVHWLAMSAMPSLHVAVPTLFALTFQQVHRRLSAAFWAFTLLILIGSVVLGWHYAIDGYVSIAVVCLLWWLSGIVRPGARRPLAPPPFRLHLPH
jgi:hypothetical protein